MKQSRKRSIVTPDYEKQFTEFLNSGNMVAIQNMINMFENIRNKTGEELKMLESLKNKINENDAFGMFGLMGGFDPT